MFRPVISRAKKRKARLQEKAILLVEKKGWDIQKAFHRYGFKISPFSYPRLLARYREGGWQNLLDTRGGYRHPKATLIVLDFIRRAKKQNPTQSAQEIALLLQERFQTTFHPNYIGILLKKNGTQQFSWPQANSKNRTHLSYRSRWQFLSQRNLSENGYYRYHYFHSYE